MANKRAAVKDQRQNVKRAAKNAREKSTVFGLLRRSRSVAAGKTGDAADLAKQAVRALDKAVAHGTLKRNTVGRLKSRLAKKLQGKK